jgi:hypothetical protein
MYDYGEQIGLKDPNAALQNVKHWHWRLKAEFEF